MFKGCGREDGFHNETEVTTSVRWVPRKCNRAADFLANLALQDKDPLKWRIISYDPKNSSNLIVMSDGGFRRVHGTAAYIVCNVNGTALDPIYLSYTYWPYARSACECELIAMTEALAKVHELIFSA